MSKGSVVIKANNDSIRAGNPTNFLAGFGFSKNPPEKSGLIREFRILGFILQIFELQIWILVHNL